MTREKRETEQSTKETKELEKKLKFSGKLCWDRLEEGEKEETFRFAEGYKAFLDRAKTERAAVREIRKAAAGGGYGPLPHPLLRWNKKIPVGDHPPVPPRFSGESRWFGNKRRGRGRSGRSCFCRP